MLLFYFVVMMAVALRGWCYPLPDLLEGRDPAVPNIPFNEEEIFNDLLNKIEQGEAEPRSKRFTQPRRLL